MLKEFLNNWLFNLILILLFLFLFFGGLYIVREILIPISFGALFALLLLPVTRKLESWKIPKGLSVFFSILIFLILVAGIIFLLSSQIAGFAKDLPQIRTNIQLKIGEVQQFIHEHTGVAPERQETIFQEKVSTFLQTSGMYLQRLFVTTTGTIATVGIIIIYVFFFLFYRQRFFNFILKITPKEHEEKTRNMLAQISNVTQSYLTGVFTVVAILSVMNVTGLLIVGVKHAVFFGVLAGMLNVIPYVGTFVGGSIPTIYALVTHDSFGFALATASVFIIAQSIEGNFLTPTIVGSKVKVNPLATILALLTGGAIWGIAGMVLFIPFLGVTKIIFDNVETLKPYGYLIGEDEDGENKPPSVLKRVGRYIKNIFQK